MPKNLQILNFEQLMKYSISKFAWVNSILRGYIDHSGSQPFDSSASSEPTYSTLIVFLPQSDGRGRLSRDASALGCRNDQLLAVQDRRHHAVGVVEPARRVLLVRPVWPDHEVGVHVLAPLLGDGVVVMATGEAEVETVVLEQL